MAFPVNILSPSEREILSFMAKYRNSDIMRFESMEDDTLKTNTNESITINTPSFHRLLLSKLIVNHSGSLYCITHNGIQCVIEYEL